MIDFYNIVYVTYTPLHPEPQGGIVYRYYYDELSLIHHRNVYSSYTQNHISTDFYYYSDFTIDIDEIDIPNIICYPNPLSIYTNFEYNLIEPTTVQISIYNQIGDQVETILKKQQSGSQKVVWDASGFMSGIYFYRMRIGDKIASGKLVILK